MFLPDKDKGSSILETSVGFRSWSRSSAVSPLVTEAINKVVGCHYFPPVPRLPPQPPSITAHWPVPNYTARWQRHMCVNNLPRVARGSRDSNPRPVDRKSCFLTTRPPSHTDLSLTFNKLVYIMSCEWLAVISSGLVLCKHWIIIVLIRRVYNVTVRCPYSPRYQLTRLFICFDRRSSAASVLINKVECIYVCLSVCLISINSVPFRSTTTYEYIFSIC